MQMAGGQGVGLEMSHLPCEAVEGERSGEK